MLQVKLKLFSLLLSFRLSLVIVFSRTGIERITSASVLRGLLLLSTNGSNLPISVSTPVKEEVVLIL